MKVNTMKTKSIIAKIKTYLRELTIVTAGVLIALFISNQKEENQARDYHSASIHTIQNEVKSNHLNLSGVIEKHIVLLDTIAKYSEKDIAINDLFSKVNGVQFATLSNTGLEFYTRNNINLIDFELMSKLYHINTLSELIEIKLERLSNFVYSNIQAESTESKMIISLYLSDVLNSESQLLEIYEDLIDEKTENNMK